MLGDLTSLDRAKAWLAPDQGNLTSQNDATIGRMVGAVSRLALNYMGRDTLARSERIETYEGGRTGTLLLRHWPVLAVVSLGIGPGPALAAADYTLEPIRPAGGCQRIYLAGGRTFIAPPPAGVAVTYTTGFLVQETLTASEDAEPSVSASFFWLGDDSVTLPNGDPVTGYTVADGVYTLPSDLSGDQVVISYFHVPPDIEQAVIQEVGMLVKSRQHIGEQSKMLAAGGGTQTYLPIDLSAITKLALDNYKRVVPA